MADNSTPLWEMPPGAKQEAPWTNTKEAFDMSDAPVFVGEEKSEADKNNKAIANASALVNYGVNTACRKFGVQGVADIVENFDASGYDDPIGAFYSALEIETKEQLEATKDRENENLDPTITNQKVSRENLVQAISDFKKLILEVKSDPRFSDLEDAARSSGDTVLNIASRRSAEKGGEPDFVGVLLELRNQKRAVEAAEKAGLGKKQAAQVVVNSMEGEEGKPNEVVTDNMEGGEASHDTDGPTQEDIEGAKLKKQLAELTDGANNLLTRYSDKISPEEQDAIQKYIDRAEIIFDDPLSGNDKYKDCFEEFEDLVKPIVENLGLTPNQLNGNPNQYFEKEELELPS